MLTIPDEAAQSMAGGSAHVVRFYDHEASLLDEVAEFIDTALRTGGTGFLIATPDHVAYLRRHLAGFGVPNGASCWYPGRLVVLDADETLASFMVDGVPDRERFRATMLPPLSEACAGGAGVHAFGEMVTLLCERGQYDAAVRLEQLWNEVSAEFAFSLFCAYPFHLFSSTDRAEAFARVCAEHGHCGMPHGAHTGAPLPGHAVLSHEQRALALEAEIARRKEAEQTLRRREKEFTDFVENAAEGLHRVAGDGTILWANRAELQMLGYTWEEYVGRHIADFHVDADVIASILGKLSSGETLYDQPARLRCKDGSVRHVVIHSNGYFEDGQLRYTRCFTRDASERRQRDEALDRLERAHAERERLLEELTNANRAKDEFLAMLGHELRNPLSPIVTALQLMRMRGETGAAREREIIERQVEHLVRLVDDLMDVSRVTRGQIELKSERGDIAQPLTKAVEMASPLIGQRGHRLTLDVAPGMEWEGDPMRLSQVVSNLLTNAARYTGNGGALTLSARRDGPDWLRISVLDNGIGLAPEVLPQVFGLFFQGKRSVDRVEGGLGIGLALVKNIVELHGGSVEAHSAGLGCGSEFVVRLPVRGVAPAALPDAIAAPAPAPVGSRIMIVDDNTDAAETLGMLLGAHGHTVEVFNDPRAALAAAGRLRPEIAVLDIGLPGLDGYELAGRLRGLLGDHACRLIALSGYGQDGDKARSEAAGFEQHLVKPISPEQVARLAGKP